MLTYIRRHKASNLPAAPDPYFRQRTLTLSTKEADAATSADVLNQRTGSNDAPAPSNRCGPTPMHLRSLPIQHGMGERGYD
jgi:hypothetical protein